MMASARRMRQVRLRRCQSLQPIHSLVVKEGELGVYKAVPPPRHLTGAQPEAVWDRDQPLSGSEPTLADLTGRLTPAQATRLTSHNTWRGASNTGAPSCPDTADPSVSAPANGLLTKKYHHIKDMLSSRFSRPDDADGRGVPLAAPEHGGAAELSAPPSGPGGRGAPFRGSVRSLTAVEGAAGDRTPWSAAPGARYEFAGAQTGAGSVQRAPGSGAPTGDQQYSGYTNGGREYLAQGYELHEYPHTSAAGPLTNGPYTAGGVAGAGGAGGAPLQRTNDSRPTRPSVAYTGVSGPARPAGFSSHQPRPPPPPLQPRPPPPAYGTRLPPPGHHFSRQGSQGRLPTDSVYAQGRGPAATTTVTARPAVSSGVSHQEPGSGDRSRPGEGQRAQTPAGRSVAADCLQVAAPIQLDSSLDSEGRPRTRAGTQRPGQTAGTEQEWADAETELRQILEPSSRRAGLTSAPSGAPSTPPLPALDGSPPRSPAGTPRLGSRGPQGPVGPNQPDLLEDTAAPGGQFAAGRLGSGSAPANRQGQSQSRGWAPRNTKESPTATRDGHERSRPRNVNRVGSLGVLGRANDSGDLPSLDIESALDQTSDQSSDESTVLEAGVDGPTVRRQLQSLETMYSEVLRLLGGQKRGQMSRPARGGGNRLRAGSSVSSLPSSIGAKPTRDRRRDDRKQLRDSRGINKRFQRLESHVVTLARSVAHLSSEMRTQHLMFQEMESIRTELAQLRQSPGAGPRPGAEFAAFRPTTVSLTHPPRVKKLTRFFGDEPPLLRIFLNQLGYEKYAPLFERERIGMLELPYMTEERLQKLGVPIGPRLRILHEAQLSMRKDSPNVYIL